MKGWLFFLATVAAIVIGIVMMGGLSGLQRTVRQTETVTEPGGSGSSGASARELEIVTILQKDGIPAILNPRFNPAEEADYSPNEQVLGISINGDSRAYSIPFLSGREIVNDTVDGKPVAITW